MSSVISLRTVTLAERPDLIEQAFDVLASRWPAFMLAGTSGHGLDLFAILAGMPEHQILLLDGAELVGLGLSVPGEWDQTLGGLSQGWDAAVAASAAFAAEGRAPSIVTALSVTITPAAAGRGLASSVIMAMKAAGVKAGAVGMLAPVRPIWKSRYPLIPMRQYVDWRTPEGEVFDPWLRLHLALGARQLAVAEQSLTVTGTVAQWEQWAGLPLPASGAYVIDGGLVPLQVDAAADRGTYIEPNVWVYHPIDPN